MCRLRPQGDQRRACAAQAEARPRPRPISVTRAEPGARARSPSPRLCQPAVIALPVPDPYGKRNVAMPAIEASLPDAVGAWIHWLLAESGWKVSERRNGAPELVPVEARHVCILFRRFVKFTDDITRPLRGRARGARHPAPARRRPVLPRSRGGRDAARGARGHRVARRCAERVRDAAGRALRARRGGAARVLAPRIPGAGSTRSTSPRICPSTCKPVARRARVPAQAARAAQSSVRRPRRSAGCSSTRART